MEKQPFPLPEQSSLNEREKECNKKEQAALLPALFCDFGGHPYESKPEADDRFALPGSYCSTRDLGIPNIFLKMKPKNPELLSTTTFIVQTS